MKLEYTLTLDDYKAAHVLHANQTLGRRIHEWFFFLIIQILAAVLLLAIFAAAVMNQRHLVEMLLPIVAGVIWIAVSYPLLRAFNLRRCFKQLFPPNRTDRSSNLEITDEGIISCIPGVSEGRIYWPGVYSFAQDDRITMIYIASKRFIFFPTTALTPAQRAELNDLIARHVPARKS